MNKKLAIMTAALCVAALGTAANAEESKGTIGVAMPDHRIFRDGIRTART